MHLSPSSLQSPFQHPTICSHVDLYTETVRTVITERMQFYHASKASSDALNFIVLTFVYDAWVCCALQELLTFSSAHPADACSCLLLDDS